MSTHLKYTHILIIAAIPKVNSTVQMIYFVILSVIVGDCDMLKSDASNCIRAANMIVTGIAAI